jgi:hypothetical protein
VTNGVNLVAMAPNIFDQSVNLRSEFANFQHDKSDIGRRVEVRRRDLGKFLRCRVDVRWVRPFSQRGEPPNWP